MTEATLAISNYPAITAQLLAAAELFETLTEIGFSATSAARSKAIDAAESTAKDVADCPPDDLNETCRPADVHTVGQCGRQIR
ncbi:MAG: hypothetical protein JWQ16_981 [Novosphingobium sp.]|nr:hypothetical protein [Novosphingobium sp.]